VTFYLASSVLGEKRLIFAQDREKERAAAVDYQHEFATIMKMGQILTAEATQIVQAPHRPSK
jgi:hypothetical protein